MTFRFDTHYNEEELKFIQERECRILSDITLTRIAFTAKPRRMLDYGGTYLAEIYDEESDDLRWAVLTTNRRGFHDFALLNPTLQGLADSL